MRGNKDVKYAEPSDDDDFILSSAPSTPPSYSRLKRPKRAKKQTAEKDSSDVICIGESADEDEIVLPEVPRVPSLPTDADGNEALHEVEQPRSTDPPDAGGTVAKRKRETASDDESEDGAGADDDEEEYNADEDSPDEDGGDSDFELEKPRKTTGAKRQAGAKKKLAVASGARAVVTKSAAKKRLGARIPTKTSSLLGGERRANGGGTSMPKRGTVFRAGLSRNAAVPRLHAYLEK